MATEPEAPRGTPVMARLVGTDRVVAYHVKSGDKASPVCVVCRAESEIQTADGPRCLDCWLRETRAR